MIYSRATSFKQQGTWGKKIRNILTEDYMKSKETPFKPKKMLPLAFFSLLLLFSFFLFMLHLKHKLLSRPVLEDSCAYVSCHWLVSLKSFSGQKRRKKEERRKQDKRKEKGKKGDKCVSFNGVQVPERRQRRSKSHRWPHGAHRLETK